MGRPRKYKIDYFPHFVASGKTMQILQHKYGNDGYAVWFKLLEVLGNTDGQHYDCTDPLDWEYLVSTFGVDGSKAMEIMNMLARIDAIDPDLWGHKVIWVQKFVDNLRQVYTKREVEMPSKPIIRDGNIILSVVSAPEMQQRKGKESKGENTEETADDAERFDFKSIVDLYHSNCPELSKVRDLTSARKTTLKAWGDINEMAEVFEIVSGSRFLNGDNDRKWKADFDWIIKPANRVKILEGKYSNGDPVKPTTFLNFQEG